MKIGIIIVIALVIVVGIFSFFFIGNQDNDNSQNLDSLQAVPGEENVEEMIVNSDSESSIIKTVEITSSGFSPKDIEINVGDTVTWDNKDSKAHWPASDNHPTHTLYSEFDALRGIGSGEEYSFTFDKKGSWEYHDHMNPSLTGTITVN
jgi:plastocyanin